MKRGRILIFLGLILGLATAAAAFYVLQGTDGELTADEPAEAPKMKVLVALQNIGQANAIDPALMELREFEQSQVPPDALMSTADVAGKLAAQDIAQGQIVRRDMVTDKKTIVEMGVNASFLIPVGKVLMAVPIDELSSAAYALEAGDTIDMLITMELVSVDPESQIKEPIPDDPAEVDKIKQIPRMVTQLTLQDVEILKIGRWGQKAVEPDTTEAQDSAQQPADEELPTQEGPTIMTVLVDQQDALVLKFARESGASIDFALRSKLDHELVTTEPVTLDYMIRRFNITPAERLPYALEITGNIE
jgi:Flp pilus assembly protein CpaB